MIEMFSGMGTLQSLEAMTRNSGAAALHQSQVSDT